MLDNGLALSLVIFLPLIGAGVVMTVPSGTSMMTSSPLAPVQFLPCP